MSAPLICTALLFRAIAYYHSRSAPPASPPPSPPPDVVDDPVPSPLLSPTRRRVQSRSTQYSPRLTTSHPAPPLLASTPSPAQPLPAPTPPRPSPRRLTPLTTSTPGEPAAYPFPVSPPPSSASLSLPSTPLSVAERPSRRAPSIASRRSSVSSSLASSTGFHPAAAATLAPVLDTGGSDVPHAPSTPGRAAAEEGGAGGSIGLGRPSGPASRLTAASPVAAPPSPSAATPPIESAKAARRSFSLPFGRRKASQPVAQVEGMASAEVGRSEGSKVPVVQRLRSFSRR